MKPRRVIRMFQRRFAADVAAGRKRQTVRPKPKVLPRAGDWLEGREWVGRPYWSKQRKLVEGAIDCVVPVVIERRRVSVAGQMFAGEQDLERFARDDGFTSWSELVAWFEHEHGLPFRGILIGWDPRLSP